MAAEDSERAVETVIVTAQRRDEKLQDVPISISVLGGPALDSSNAQGITDALNRVAGVATTIAFQGGGTQVSVRGVSSSGPLFAGSSPTGYYLDSVPFGLVRTSIAPDANAFDLQRVEVLRGPQGTLYGANALSGVVRVLTQDARLDRFEFKARTSASSTEDGSESYRGDLAVNVPIVEGKLAARAVVGYQDLGGWIDRPNLGVEDANDAEIINTRLKVNAQPTDNLSVGLLAWISRADFGAPPTGAGDDFSTSFVEEPTASDYDVFGLKATYEFSNFSVTSMTSHIDFRQEGYVDLASTFGTPPQRVRLLTELDSKVLSQEFVVNSTSEGNWRWSAGAMYRDAEDHNYQFRINRIVAGRTVPIDWSDTSESLALFGEATRLFLDGQLELTAGLRYFEDEVSMQENQKADGSTNPLIVRDSKFDATTPRVTLTAHANQDLTFYASYSEGFRSGFDQNPLALAGAPLFPPVKPDTLSNYEVGAKGTFFGGLVSLESAVFYTDWEDIQQALSVLFLGANVAVVTNAETASGLGVDFSGTLRPLQGLEFGVTFGWNDLSFDSNVVSIGAGQVPVSLFTEGDRINLSPEYTAGASADYEFALGSSGFQGHFSVSANYISELFNRSISGTAVQLRSGDEMLTGRVSFAVNAPNYWSATLFVDNVTDERGIVLPQSVADRNTRIRPRTIGAQLEYRF